MKPKGRLKTYIRLPLWLTILFAALAFVVFFLNRTAGILCVIFVAIYFIIVLLVYRRSNHFVLDEMVDFAMRYGTVQGKLLNEFEIPFAILDQNARFLWMNRNFSELTGKDQDSRASIASIFPAVTKDRIAGADYEDITVTKDDKVYRAAIRKIAFPEMADENVDTGNTEQAVIVVYLFDETQINDYENERRDMQMVPALVYIDNYEEVLEDMEEVNQSQLISMVDSSVNDYFSSRGGIVKKTETDKYFVVFPHKYLKEMTETGFTILEDVQSLRGGTDVPVTLSIGLSDSSLDYGKDYGYARMAIDLALGRGGNQAVLKSGDKTYYFGGGARQVDRTTRVKARVKALALREIMVNRDNFIIMGHSIADVDCLGAAIGIYCAARQLGKRAQIVLDTVTTSLRPFVECFSPANGYPDDLFLSGSMALERVDSGTALIVVDTNRPSYAACPDLLTKVRTLVVFDHHRSGAEIFRNADLSYLEPYASSACEMISEVLQYFDEDIHLSSAEADALYAGILLDTNNFVTKTGVRTFEAAAYLRRCGADSGRVRKLMRNDMSAYKARAEAIRRAEVYRGAFAISVCPADNIESPTVACAQAANELLNVVGIKASFVLTDYKGKIYISARSIDEINVQLIMERLGGGGHVTSAGAQLTGCTIEAAEQTIRTMIDELMEEKDKK